MMPFLAFLFEAVLISLSGVMAPGPVTAVAVGKGSESPHAGALIAIGHGIVEFPLMIAIFYGFGRFLSHFYVRAGIALLGGVLLLAMGVGMFRSVRQVALGVDNDSRSPIIAGIVLSVGNPYFLIWWATVGAALILRSAGFGFAGFSTFALLHWFGDFLWDYFLSALSFRGGRFFGRAFQKVVFAVCGVLLVFFGGRFIADAIRVLPLLP